MRFLIFSLFFVTSLFSQEIDNSFITKFEYGAMLYDNPRGIGCVKCHAKGDKPVIIAKYKEKDKKGKKLIEKSIIAPAINNVSFEVFIDKMTADKTESKIMPTYFLTDEELKSLYYYIKNINKK
ncbi:c-type cytochrome [Campylobacterota bacterium DY0563]|uniref:c-type cytochrome n=1 Tax=Halarcobacter sp. TaxID=2321133 RepID=UPI0029F54301|nr:c-type cytochrome [Halarcobacter sp.]